MDGHGWQGMLENDGVLFWKHTTRKKWAEKHAVRRILRIVYKIGSFESADGVCNDSVWYACAWHNTTASNVCATPRDAKHRNGECRGLLYATDVCAGHDYSQCRPGIVCESTGVVLQVSAAVRNAGGGGVGRARWGGAGRVCRDRWK